MGPEISPYARTTRAARLPRQRRPMHQCDLERALVNYPERTVVLRPAYDRADTSSKHTLVQRSRRRLVRLDLVLDGLALTRRRMKPAPQATRSRVRKIKVRRGEYQGEP